MTDTIRRRATGMGPFVAAGLAALVLVGCGGGDQEASGNGDGGNGGNGGGEPASAEFVAVDIDWEDAPDELPAGETNLVLDNQGEIEHTLAFEGIEGGEPVVEAEPGETAEATTQLEPGTYTYYCTVGNHREAGMEGTLEVTE